MNMKHTSLIRDVLLAYVRNCCVMKLIRQNVKVVLLVLAIAQSAQLKELSENHIELTRQNVSNAVLKNVDSAQSPERNRRGDFCGNGKCYNRWRFRAG